jgi:hypothetical protein
VPLAAPRLLDAGDGIEDTEALDDELVGALVERALADRTDRHDLIVGDSAFSRTWTNRAFDTSGLGVPPRAGQEQGKTMTAAQLEEQETTTEEVVVWRFEQLLEAGYEKRSARILARRRDVDLHQAVELVARGCPQDLAFSILR